MIETFFEILRYMLTMLFGVLISAEFLEIRLNIKKNIIILGLFYLIDMAMQGLFFMQQSVEIITAIYPLLAHLPLLLLFVLWYKKKWFPSVLAITTAYLCCQIANWISMLCIYAGTVEWIVNGIYSIGLVLTFVVIKIFVVPPFAHALLKSDKALISFSIVPVFYYIFDYISTVYTELFYVGNMVAVEFPPFLLAVCYIVFCAMYFKQYEEAQEIENRNRLIEIKQQQSQKDIDRIKHNEKKITILKHDMRHFLNNVYKYIENDEVEKAQEYIVEIMEAIEKTSQKRYCTNDTINNILSYYSDIMEEKSITFNCDVQIPSKIRVSDVDITSVLSNGLENAYNEVIQLDEEKRVIELSIIEKNGKLLISLENTHKNKPLFVDGLPLSNKKGHGIGTQSIKYTVEKLNGNCQFSVTDEKFIMQIVL